VAEGVVSDHCGYRWQLDPAVGRTPVSAIEQAVRALLFEHEAFVAVVERWLRVVCGCPAYFVGIRYPPAFTALIADIAAEVCLPHVETTDVLDTARIASEVERSGMHPARPGSVPLSCRHHAGLLRVAAVRLCGHPPPTGGVLRHGTTPVEGDGAEITRGWSPEALEELASAGDVCSPAVLRLVNVSATLIDK
jgi:hypothetical protein